MRKDLRMVIKEKGFAFGTFMANFSMAQTEVFSLAGVDFLVFDSEHGCLDFQEIETLVRCVELYGITGMVRMPYFNKKQIGRLFDIGAHGIQMPMVHTAEQARQVVDAVKYKPLGTRGVGMGRGQRWGTIPDYHNKANKDTFIVVMCESKEAVDNMEEICKVPGVDAVFIGTGDLSFDLDVRDSQHPEVEKCVQHVLKVCKANNVIPGMTVPSVEETKVRIKQGFQYLTLLNDMRLLIKLITGIVQDVNS
jgi:2-dehydro-3-deoxyglucarate aldolase/4-hydroxy-2-oxoheptanedioate aldolase